MAKEKQTRRMIAMALAAAVTMSSVPVVAFADEVSDTPSVTSESTTTESGDGSMESPRVTVTVTPTETKTKSIINKEDIETKYGIVTYKPNKQNKKGND